MKFMIASDLHGSAYYTRQLLDAFQREGADRLLLLGDILYHGPRNDPPRDYAPKQVIAMLSEVKDKLAQSAGAAFYHISTCSVSGERLHGSDNSADFTEKDFDIGQDWESNIYVRSKFLAETAVRQAAEAGLHTKIFRLGRLVGRMSDGLFQRNPHTNAFYLLMKSFLQIGAVPQSAADIRGQCAHRTGRGRCRRSTC